MHAATGAADAAPVRLRHRHGGIQAPVRSAHPTRRRRGSVALGRYADRRSPGHRPAQRPRAGRGRQPGARHWRARVSVLNTDTTVRLPMPAPATPGVLAGRPHRRRVPTCGSPRPRARPGHRRRAALLHGRRHQRRPGRRHQRDGARRAAGGCHLRDDHDLPGGCVEAPAGHADLLGRRPSRPARRSRSRSRSPSIPTSSPNATAGPLTHLQHRHACRPNTGRRPRRQHGHDRHDRRGQGRPGGHQDLQAGRRPAGRQDRALHDLRRQPRAVVRPLGDVTDVLLADGIVHRQQHHAPARAPCGAVDDDGHRWAEVRLCPRHARQRQSLHRGPGHGRLSSSAPPRRWTSTTSRR